MRRITNIAGRLKHEAGSCIHSFVATTQAGSSSLFVFGKTENSEGLNCTQYPCFASATERLQEYSYAKAINTRVINADSPFINADLRGVNADFAYADSDCSGIIPKSHILYSDLQALCLKISQLHNYYDNSSTVKCLALIKFSWHAVPKVSKGGNKKIAIPGSLLSNTAFPFVFHRGNNQGDAGSESTGYDTIINRFKTTYAYEK